MSKQSRQVKRQPSRRKIQCLRRRNTRTRHRSLAQDHQATGSFGRTYFTNRLGGLFSFAGRGTPSQRKCSRQPKPNEHVARKGQDRPPVGNRASLQPCTVRSDQKLEIYRAQQRSTIHVLGAQNRNRLSGNATAI